MHFLLIVLALLQPALGWAQSRPIGIDGGAGVQMIATEAGRAGPVFSLSSLHPLGGIVQTDETTARLTLLNDTISFTLGSPFFKAGRDKFQLAAPVLRRGRTVLVSTQFLTEWLPRRHNSLTFKDNILRKAQQPAPVSPTREPALSPAPAPAPVITSRDTAKPQRNETAKRPRDTAGQPMAKHPITQTRVVIIDAGHGGKDPGKTGPNGLTEKTVTLSIANKLNALLRDRGYEVHMTRTQDTLIKLEHRPHLANQWKNGRPAALFVSIHANAGPSKAHGFETYFLSEARTEDERRVAEMENAAVAFEEKSSGAPAIEQLLTGLRNDYYQRASNDFAEVIQRELGAFHPGASRGVKQAGFRVLVGAVMPAVLVEIAFISNAEEAKLLGTAAFQDKIAYSLSRSISNFFDSHEHLWLAPESSR